MVLTNQTNLPTVEMYIVVVPLAIVLTLLLLVLLLLPMSSPRARRMIISFLPVLLMMGLAFASPYHEIYATAMGTATTGGAKTCTTACPVCDPCPIIVSLFPQSPIWTIFSNFLSTCEVILRSFALGFGVRMLVYIFMEYPKEQPQQQRETEGDDGGVGGGGGGSSSRGRNINILNDMNVRRNIQIAILTGVAMASAVFGSSLFIPTNFRMQWFNYN
jgi:hypothetical protein